MNARQIWSALAVLAWIVCYVPLALKRVYGGRLVPAVLRAGLVTSLYGIAALAAVAVLALLLVFTY